MADEYATQTSNLAINHIGISVSDLDGAVEWYINHLGFKQIRSNVTHKRNEEVDRKDDIHIFRIYDSPMAEAKVAYLLSSNNIGIELFQFISPEYSGSEPFSPKTYTRAGVYHIAVTHPDPKALLKTLVAAGASQIGETANLAHGQTVLYVQDPFGLVIEVCSKSFAELVRSV